MCGIAGIIAKDPLLLPRIGEYAASAGERLSHRGPDDKGAFFTGSSAFVHRRLSIVDIAGGRQPMTNASGNIGIIYNGEVYNHEEIRRRLEGEGRVFRTDSDTEALLLAYEQYGVKAFAMFNGMFAFCIWDASSDAVYLARDRFGTKPLYLYEDEKMLIFASELQAIVGLPGLDLSLDPAGFRDYLRFRYVQAPYTMFKRIRRLEAGTYVEIKNGRTVRWRYWDVAYPSSGGPFDPADAQTELKARLQAAVGSQLMGEAPIGVLLSGGVDSSAIACLVHACGADLKTFNIGFPDVNEFEYSRAVAKKFGLKHIEVLTTPEELMENIDPIVRALDEPLADPACFPLYILAREIKKHVTVVLSGEGGDELFGGYLQYRRLLDARLPYSARFDEFMRRSWYFADYDDFMVDGSLPDHTLRHKKYFEEYPLLNGMLAFDMKTWMPENLMMKADKILMAHSLEGRFPFLDTGLFEFASCLPQNLKISRDGTQKWLLKSAFAPLLPSSVIDRPKMGFTVPVQDMMKTFKPLVFDAINSLYGSPLTEVFDLSYAKRYLDGYYKKEGVLHLQAWTLFIMCYWFANILRPSAAK